jgi:hypothetical protein
MSSSTPMWRAMALMWIGALVEPPMAELTTMAFSKAFARQDVGGLQVLPHHLDDALAGLVGDLAALAVGRRDRGAAGQRHAERLGQRVHGRGRAHGVAVADRGRRRGDELDELLVVDLAGGQQLARLPDDGAGAGALALAQPLSIGPPTARWPGC